MGKGVSKRRSISSERVRKIKKLKNKIIIAVEGSNKTEKIYFDNFDDGKKSYSITIAKGNDTDPLKLVKALNNEILKMGLNLSEGDAAFCVFDTDVDRNKNKIISEAKKYAENHGIKIITSTPSVEVWFLLHYDYTTAAMLNDDVIKRLKLYYPKYEKNVNIYLDINKDVLKAIDNAKRLELYQVDNGREIGTVEANPSTEMYKIVEYLMR